MTGRAAVTWAPAFDEMHLLTPLPAVVSVSSAYSESFYQGEARGPTYECEDEVQLCTLAARGATVVAGSGDMGECAHRRAGACSSCQWLEHAVSLVTHMLA